MARRRTPVASGPHQSAHSTTSPPSDTHSASASRGSTPCGTPGASLAPVAGTRAATSSTNENGGDHDARVEGPAAAAPARRVDEHAVDADDDVVEAAGGVWVATGIDNTLVHLDARAGGLLDRLPLPRGIAASAHAVAAGEGAVWVTSGERLLKIAPRTGAVLGGVRSLGCCGERELLDVEVGAGAV